MKKSPNPVDKHVGSRIRTRRLLVGLSQEKLGEGLGITFQQVQKYEGHQSDQRQPTAASLQSPGCAD